MNVFQDYNYNRNKLGSYSCFIVAGKLKKSFTKEEITHSLEYLITRRKALRCNVLEGKIEEVEIRLSNVLQFEDRPNKDIVRITDELHNTTFKTDSPNDVLWKIVVNGDWLFLLCDHTLVDGTSAVLILEDLSLLLNHMTIGDEVELKTDSLYQPSFWFIMKILLYESFKRPARLPFEGLSKNISTFHTLKKLLQLDSEHFLQLKKEMAKEKVTFTALLTYLNYQALSATDIKVSIPVNLRKFLGKETERSYGLCVSGIELDLKLKREFTWNDVRQINAKITESNQKYSAQMVGMLNYVDKYEYLKKKVGSPREITLEISNLGKRTSEGIEQFLFSQPNNHSGPLITNDVISTTTHVNILVSASPEMSDYFDDYASKLENFLFNNIEY